MAALVGSIGGARSRFVACPDRARLRLVGRDGDESDPGARPVDAERTVSRFFPVARRTATLRRVSGTVATFVALAGLWVGAGALRATQNAPAGSAGHGVVYVARPGDTLWAIATRLDPAGDPVEVVATLAAELHGAVLRPGAVLTVPSS